MLRLTNGARGSVLLLGLLACTADLTTPGVCPQTCPGGVVQVRDTVLEAVLGMDSAFTGYVLAGEGTGLLVSTLEPTNQYLAAFRFGARPDSVRIGDSLYAYTIDSVAISVGVLARDSAATGIVLQLYRAPASLDSGVTYADLASYTTPATFLDSVVVPDTLENGNLRAVFSGADLLKVAIPPADSGVLSVAVGMTADSPTGVELGSPSAGSFLPTITTYIHVAAVDSTKQPSAVQRVPTFGTYVEQNPPVPDPDQLQLGGAPSSRILIRFSVTPAALLGLEILRAELVVTPVGPIQGVPNIGTTMTARGVLSDQGAKSPLVPLLASTTSLLVGSADSVTLEVLALVKAWQLPTSPPAQAFFLSLQPEGSSFTRPVFASTRSLSGAPHLRITYVAPLDFQEP
jgi:hypothetical protein